MKNLLLLVEFASKKLERIRKNNYFLSSIYKYLPRIKREIEFKTFQSYAPRPNHSSTNSLGRRK